MFESFKNKNWRLYFFSQIFALVGKSVQMVAVSWLAFEVTNSPIYLGWIVAMQYLPLLVFGFFAGHWLDKYSKYQALRNLQILQVLAPFLLCIYVFFFGINISALFAVATVFGVLALFDSPLRHSFLSYIVPKEEIKTAYSLYASASQIARVGGPVLGGVMLVWVSPFWCFLVTGLTYLLVSILYSQMDTSKFHIAKDVKNNDSNILDTFKYIWGNQTMRDLVWIGLYCAIFFWSYTTYFPIMVKEIFKSGAVDFSLLVSAYAFGSVFGNLFSASHKDLSYAYLRKVLIAFSVISIVFAVINNYILALIVMCISGFFVSQINAITNSLVRINAEDKYLGSVMSTWLVITVGFTALGGVYYGYMATHFGIKISLILPPIILLFFSIFHFGKGEKGGKIG